MKSDVRLDLDLDLDRDLHPDRPASKAAVRLPVPSCNARYFTALLCTHSDLQLLRYVALRWSWVELAHRAGPVQASAFRSIHQW